MKVFKNLLYIIFTIIVLCIVLFLILHFFDKFFVQKNENYIVSGIGAFAGAFFSFLFIKIADRLEDIRKRRKRHIDALVEIEYILNKNLTYIHDNSVNVSKLIECIEQKIFYVGNYIPLKFNENLLINLVNIDFINDTFSYGVSVDKINEDLKTIKQHYEHIKQLYFEGRISTENLHKQLIESKFLDDLKMMVAKLKTFDRETENLIVKLQVLFEKDQTFFNKVMIGYFGNRYPSNFKKQCDKKLITFRRGREKIRNESLKEINKVKKEFIRKNQF